MHSKRAQQIIDTKKRETVYYKNQPVMIMEVNPQGDRVKVKSLHSGKELEVNPKTLNEDFGLKQ